MTYIPPIALQLKPFSNVEEMNVHMNLQYIIIKSKLTKSYDLIFHLIKKYACKVAGVCWLRQEKLAALAEVSVKTVERALQFLKECGVVKIYHTKRSNGLNGSCYYVLQPFKGELPMNDEIIVSVEEENVGAVEVVQPYETSNLQDDPIKDKLSLSSFKALENSFKKEEEINYITRVKTFCKESNMITEEAYHDFVIFLVNNHFSKEAATEITKRVLRTCKVSHPGEVLRAYARSMQNLQKRLSYQQPIHSMIAYFASLVVEEIRPSFLNEKPRSQQSKSTLNSELVECLKSFTDRMTGK